MNATRRGLRHVRTCSGGCASRAAKSPAATHLKLAFLALERERRLAERVRLTERIEDIAARLLEIDGEVLRLETGTASSAPSRAAPEPTRGASARSRPEQRRRAGGGLTLRY